MNLNPVFDKEIKRNCRSMKISWIVFGCNLVLGTIAVISFFGEGVIHGYMQTDRYRMPIRCYMMMSYALFLMVALLIPGITAGSISLEREKQTLDVLLTTNLNPWKIITGKLEASLSMVFLLAVSAMPAVALVMVFGGVGFLDLIALVALLVISGIFIGSLGILCSALFKRTTLATLMAYVLLIFFVAGTAAIVMIASHINVLQNEAACLYDGRSDIGGLVYLLLLNPFASFFSLLSGQVGNGREMLDICNAFGDYSQSFVVNHFSVFAAGIQLILSGGFIALSGALLNPLRKK